MPTLRLRRHQKEIIKLQKGDNPPYNALIYSVSLSHAEPSCRCISGREKSKEMSGASGRHGGFALEVTAPYAATYTGPEGFFQ